MTDRPFARAAAPKSNLGLLAVTTLLAVLIGGFLFSSATPPAPHGPHTAAGQAWPNGA